MSNTIDDCINYELQRLNDYLKYLEDFKKEYDTTLAKYYRGANPDKITKDQSIKDLEREIQRAQERARSLLFELQQVRNRYHGNLNIENDIRNFYSHASAAKLPIFNDVVLQFTRTVIEEDIYPQDEIEGYDGYEDGLPEEVPTGAAAPLPTEEKDAPPDENTSHEDPKIPLNGRISKSDIDLEKEQFERDVKQWEQNIEKTKYWLIGKMGLTIKGKADSAGMLNLAEGKGVCWYTKDAIKLKNIHDSKFDNFRNGKLLKYRSDMTNKIIDQFKDFNYELNDIKGIIFKSNSAPVKRIKKSKEFKKILRDHQKDIDKNQDFSARFIDDVNFHFAFGSVDFKYGGFDKKGNLHLYMFDTYDFNKDEDAAVEAGRRQMLKGNLKGFFSIHDIIIKKRDLEKYGL